MAATGITSSQDSSAFSGPRAVHLRHDLAAIADLIEYSFASSLDLSGRAAIQEMRLISRTGPLLWALGRLNNTVPGLMQGFVWIEKGRLVGNVSITPAFDKGWAIANVAVYPEYRRRGIARQLMQMAMEWIAERGTFATLQVEADNTPARALYQSLNFIEQRTFTRWRRPTFHRIPEPPAKTATVRSLSRRDSGSLYALARFVGPDELGGMGWLRPTKKKEFLSSRWGVLGSLLGGQQNAYWGVLGRRGGLDAALLTRIQWGNLTASFDLLVRPECQGQFEAALVYEAVRQIGGRLRPLITEHPADDDAAEMVFRQYNFRPERTLVHMIWHVS